MSCESCTGCFSATPCSAPSPSLNGHISKEYRQFLKYARVCDQYLSEDESTSNDDNDQSEASGSRKSSPSNKSTRKEDKRDHAFNSLIGVLANNQFTAQTFLAQSYKQLGPRSFLELSRLLAQHGFWGRLITWAYLSVKEDSSKLKALLEAQDPELVQTVNDEAEMFEVFNTGVNCQRALYFSTEVM
ncbi:hypothetical protein BGZ93_004532 [Podila epicladia]|nr:hypothetical protein BGZ92_007802 [Podila epicladia]KAG0096442.1 hypothetical protein BGZ93_004532 [Podila epicladia]